MFKILSKKYKEMTQKVQNLEQQIISLKKSEAARSTLASAPAELLTQEGCLMKQNVENGCFHLEFGHENHRSITVEIIEGKIC